MLVSSLLVIAFLASVNGKMPKDAIYIQNWYKSQSQQQSQLPDHPSLPSELRSQQKATSKFKVLAQANAPNPAASPRPGGCPPGSMVFVDANKQLRPCRRDGSLTCLGGQVCSDPIDFSGNTVCCTIGRANFAAQVPWLQSQRLSIPGITPPPQQSQSPAQNARANLGCPAGMSVVYDPSTKPLLPRFCRKDSSPCVVGQICGEPFDQSGTTVCCGSNRAGGPTSVLAKALTLSQTRAQEAELRRAHDERIAAAVASATATKAPYCPVGEPILNHLTGMVQICNPDQIDPDRACGYGNKCQFSNTTNNYICCGIQRSCNAGWDYDMHGSVEWPSFCPQCGGQKQSPIIFRTKLLTYKPALPQVQLFGYDDPVSSFTIINNGHAAQVNLPENTNITIVIPTQPNRRYKLKHVHFHWGQHNLAGSDHAVGATNFPLEVHLVHTMEGGEGFAALGAFGIINCTDEVTDEMATVTNALDSVIDAGASVTVQGQFKLANFLPVDRSQFFAYAGSLTRPPCPESVEFTIFKNPINVSPKMLTKLRKLLDSHHQEMNANHRVPQPLNGRQVFFRGSSAPKYNYKMVADCPAAPPLPPLSGFQPGPPAPPPPPPPPLQPPVAQTNDQSMASQQQAGQQAQEATMATLNDANQAKAVPPAPLAPGNPSAVPTAGNTGVVAPAVAPAAVVPANPTNSVAAGQPIQGNAVPVAPAVVSAGGAPTQPAAVLQPVAGGGAVVPTLAQGQPPAAQSGQPIQPLQPLPQAQPAVPVATPPVAP